MRSLGVNPTALIWHLVNFLILLFILQRFLYKPVLRMLDERSARIRDSMNQAEEARAEVARLRDDSKDILDAARRESQEILATANRNSERILSEARQQAQTEADRIVERARAELVRERDQAFAELRQQVADLAVMAAGHVIRRSLDDAAHRQLVQELIADGRQGQPSA